MPTELTVEQAAARLKTTDTLGMPLGPGQPPAFLRALGERDDWEDLRVYGALLAVGTELFSRTDVHYLSGFFGPFERALRDAGANIGFTPADFRRFGPLLERQATARDDDRRDAAGCRRLVLPVAARGRHDRRVAPRGRRSRPDARRRGIGRVSADVRARRGPPPCAARRRDRRPRAVDRRTARAARRRRAAHRRRQGIARHAVDFIPSGATLQTGIGSIPNHIATLLAEGDGGDYGLHSEMFTDGCMQLHRAGKVTNAGKGQYDGVSVTTFAFGSPELYAWLDGNDDVAFLPVEIVNSPEVIGANDDMITINGALAMDIHGQVVADTIYGDQFSGIGGAEDFVAGAGLELSDRSLICLPSTFAKDDGLQSRIVPWFGPGAVITTPRHQVDVIVTEYGVAELEGKTVHERGEALAAIAHPQFRDELLAAAERASKGRSPVAPWRLAP